ncbi:MAG: DUF736 domain-containing protein [Xanthobacteraceae bacterium]
MIIGKFTQQKDGRITGSVETLTHITALTFTPTDKGIDYVVTTESGCEVGAGWKRTVAKSGKLYVSVKLDSPFLPAPVHCALFPQKDGSQALIWDRKPKDEADTTAQAA